MTSESLYKQIVGQKSERYLDMVIDDLVEKDVAPED